MRNIFFLIFFLFLLACDSNPSDNAGAASTTDTAEATSDTDASFSVKRMALLDHLDVNSPNWKLMPQQLWLPPQYVTAYNNATQEDISYEKNTLIFGDFNGDRQEDAMALLMNNQMEIWLMVLFGKEGGYDLEPVFSQHEGVLQQCCLGIGLKTVPPGNYADINSGNKVKVDHQAIEYTVYEKVSFLIYLKNDRFRTLRLRNREQVVE